MRAVVDHHVDRPEVEAGQPAQPTGTNRSIGFERPHPAARTIQVQVSIRTRIRSVETLAFLRGGRRSGSFAESQGGRRLLRRRNQRSARTHAHSTHAQLASLRRRKQVSGTPDPCLLVLTPGGLARPGGHSEGQNTRSHPELGRENPQRRWYCVLRRGRVGRRQALQALRHQPELTRGGAAR